MEGTITATNWPVHPSLLITMNSGTIPSWVGTAIVAITNISNCLRPRKRSFANEYPDSVEKTTTDTAVITETTTEFHTAGQNLISASRTRRTFNSGPRRGTQGWPR